MEIILSKLSWSNRNELWVTGFIFLEEKFLREEDLLDFFSGADSIAEFESKLKSATGQFSVVTKHGNEIWAATDRTRNWPLFYTRIENQFIISDDCYRLVELRNENQFDPVSYNCFLSSGYTLNDRTLVRDVFQVEAGALTVFTDKTRSWFYHNPAEEKTIEENIETASEGLSLLLDSTFRRYFSALDDKFIAIPLSGGYDSRLVALMASRYHPQNILCYTYGRRDNPEVLLAMEAANRLKMKWINIIYDSELVKDFIHDGFFDTYYRRVSNLTGMFFLQEYFAVRYLKQKEMIPENTVFISGYSGDFIAGSYITPAMRKSLDGNKLSELIFSEYFRLVGLGRDKKSEICRLIRERMPSGRSDAWKIVESWDLKERHAKFIINSAKVFTFFGYEYVFPLWDNRLVDYMLPLSYNLRMDRKLYEYTLRNHIFRENNMNLDNETNPAPVNKSIQRLKETIKPLMPSKLRNKFINPYNAIYYDGITKILLDDLKSKAIVTPRQPNYYNSYIIQWYLEKTAEKYSLKLIR